MIQQEESIKVAIEILDKFTAWADVMIWDFQIMPKLNEDAKARHQNTIDTLTSAKKNLNRIIREVTELQK